MERHYPGPAGEQQYSTVIPTQMIDLSIRELGTALRNREFSSVELARTLLARIDSLDPQVGSFLTVTEPSALASAEQADRQLAQGSDARELKDQSSGWVLP